jgi:acetylxylan esterase
MPCAKGGTQKTGPQWAKLVHDAYPGYTGKYPKMQIWHGTSDFVVRYATFIEQLKQWSAIHGVSFTKNASGDPQAGYTKMIYGDGSQVLGFSGQGVGHVVPQHAKQVLEWWGI